MTGIRRPNPSARASLRRSAMILPAAVVVGMIAAGCHSLGDRKASKTPKSPEPLGPTGTATAKTDFRRDASPGQQFNVHLELGRMYEGQGNLEAAVGEYAKAVEAADKKTGSHLFGRETIGPPQEALAERRLAGALDNLGRFAQAEVHYTRALKLAPRDVNVWNDVGYSYYLQNRWPDAERALKTADVIEPNNPRVLTNLGLALAALGKDDEALAVLTRSGGPAVGHANLGFIFAAMGRNEDARVHYQKALALQPQLGAARVALEKLRPSAPGAPAAAVVAKAGSHAEPKPRRSPPVDRQVALTSATGGVTSVPPVLPIPVAPSRTLPAASK